MKRVLTVTKTTRVLKIRDLLADMQAGISDEELLDRHDLRWDQLEKVYSKLYYGGFLSQEDLSWRVELRNGKDASHIPFTEIEASGTLYQCGICGFVSPLHFSTCPRCREINLRRLTSRIPQPAASGQIFHHGAY